MNIISSIKLALATVGFVLLSACAHTGNNSGINTEQSAARLNVVIDDLIVHEKIAGMSILILEDGEQAYFRAAGMLNREASSPMTRSSVGRYYSMTKPIVGVAMMQLFEAGKYNIDDPVANYLPEFASMTVFTGMDEAGAPTVEAANRAITIRDLMRHTSGLTYGFITQTPVDIMYLKTGVLSFDNTGAQFSQKLATLPLLAHPGEKFIYGMSTDVLGRLVEVLSGQTLGDYLQANIFTPLNMTHTAFTVSMADSEDFGPIYKTHEGKLLALADGMAGLPFKVNEPYMRDLPFQSGGGGLVSTIDDYAKFTLMLRDRGGDIMSRKSHARMTSDQLGDIDNSWLGNDTSFGLNFALKVSDPAEGALPIPKGSYYWGGAAGTYFWIDPKNDLIFIMQMQMMGHAENNVRDRVARAVYGELAE